MTGPPALRHASSVCTLSPCAAENSLRPSPLCSNSETRRSISARLRLCIPAPAPFVLMPPLQHRSKTNGRMGLLECIRKTAAARMAVKGAPLSSAFIGAKRRPLTATAAEATALQRAGRPIHPRSFAFNMFTPRRSRALSPFTNVDARLRLQTPPSQVADPQHVHARKHRSAKGALQLPRWG